MEIVIRIIMFILSILSLFFSCMALKTLNRSPSKELVRGFEMELKKCKKEHKKEKDYEDCSNCIWNDDCWYWKKSKEVNADGKTEDT